MVLHDLGRFTKEPNPLAPAILDFWPRTEKFLCKPSVWSHVIANQTDQNA